jgi:hypothetical protein
MRRILFLKWSPCVFSLALTHEGCLEAHALAGNLSGMNCLECGSTDAYRCYSCSRLMRIEKGSCGCHPCLWFRGCGHLTSALKISCLLARCGRSYRSHWNSHGCHSFSRRIPLRQLSSSFCWALSFQTGTTPAADSLNGAIKQPRQDFSPIHCLKTIWGWPSSGDHPYFNRQRYLNFG